MAGDSKYSEDEVADWELLFDNVPDTISLLEEEAPLFMDCSSNPSPDSVSPWIDQIETILMKDEDDDKDHSQSLEENYQQFCSDFLSDILLDLPDDKNDSNSDLTPSDDNNSQQFCADDKNSNSNSDAKATLEMDESETGEADDPISKKRKRQIRNRDAALRSRERKKMYVRDLELKSRYLEGECRRLGRLLQCSYQENQALRLCLQKGNEVPDASMTKQESAVLFLESLLLGSLFWFLCIICLFNLPRLGQSNLDLVPLEGAESKSLVSGAPRVEGSKISGSVLIGLSFTSRRCKASKTKMKSSFVTLGILV